MRKKPIFSLDPDQLERLLSIGTGDLDPAEEQKQQTDANGHGKDGEDVVSGERHLPGERIPSVNATSSLVGMEQSGGQIDHSHTTFTQELEDLERSDLLRLEIRGFVH